MAEGMTPHHYDRQVQEAEAYNLKMQHLEKQGSHQHHFEPKPISKTRSVLLAILAVVMIAGLMLAIAAICMYPLYN